MMKKKNLEVFVLIFCVISQIFLIFAITKIENSFLRNDTWEKVPKIKTELPQLSITQTWGSNGTIISKASSAQYYPEICSDGAGGAIITWWDYRNGSNFDIYAQRIDSSGNVQWTPDGVAICTAINDQYSPQICSDGIGGAIITWTDYRSGSNYDIYSQKINSSGNVQWTADGVATCTAIRSQGAPEICNDRAGGAIITWEDSRSGSNNKIYAQRINSLGNIQWTADGVAICTASSNQENPEICKDGAGGAIITWGVYRIYAQRINSSGNVLWPADGVAICTASLDREHPQICSDGAGGAIITWDDSRSGPSFHMNDIYAQRINSSGNVQWTANGVAICTIITNQRYPEICSDGAGGGIITWEDFRNDPSSNIYAQRVNATGDIQWNYGGVRICTAINDQTSPEICNDGAGGGIITWCDNRSGSNYDIYAQEINSSGKVQWTADGIAICTAINGQYGPQICSDGVGGAIITWSDFRSGAGGTSNDIYAQHIAQHTNYDPAEPENGGIPFELIITIASFVGIAVVIGIATTLIIKKRHKNV